MKNGGNSTSVVLVALGFFLFAYSVIGAPTEMVWGRPFYVWPMFASWLMIAVGLVLGIFSVVFVRVTKRSAARRWVAEADNDEERRRRRRMVNDMGAGAALAATGAAGISAAHLVNVDGTPMVDGGMVDVMGKAYGDDGTAFDHHEDMSMSDSHSFNCMDSSSAGGSNW